MTRETKIGLLVGMGVIVFIAILISEYFSHTQHQADPQLSQLADQRDPAPIRVEPPVTDRQTELPTPGEAVGPVDTPVVVGRDQPRPFHQRSIPLMAQENDSDGFEADSLVMGQPAEPTPAETHTADRWYTVKEGDNLTKIARKVYGDGDYAQVIYEANRHRMTSINSVRVGVRLLIPDRAGRATPAPAETRTETPSAPRDTATTEYKVKDGETLTELAQRFYGSQRHWNKLYELNRDRIDDPDRVRAGTVIRVPRR